MKRCALQAQQHFARHARGRLEMPAVAHDQRNRDRRQSEEAPFHGRGHRAGIEHVVAEVGAVVDARDHHVVIDLAFEQARNGEVDAVRGGAVDEMAPRTVFGDAQRDV